MGKIVRRFSHIVVLVAVLWTSSFVANIGSAYALEAGWEGLTAAVALPVASAVKVPVVKNVIDDSMKAQGAILVSYAGSKKGKLRIEKDGQQYNYDLFVGAEAALFPLQLGNGKYSIKMYEHIEGNRYRLVLQKEISAKISKIAHVYLHNMQVVNWQKDDEAILLAAKKVKDLKSDRARLQALHQEVVKHIAYDYDKMAVLEAGYIPQVAQVWEEAQGICFDYAVVLGAMLRSQGIPAKLVKGYSPDVEGYHAWNEVYLADEGRWVVVDATVDAIRAAGNLPYNMIKSPARYNKVYEY